MKNLITISTSFDQPELLEDLVEKLALRRYDAGYSKEKMPINFRAFSTSSTETYASGTVALTDSDENINMPFITRFFFTCIKEKGEEYKLTWASSMN